MKNWGEQAEEIMRARFGKDTVIALATEENGEPFVRFVNAFYEDRKFYVITWGLSAKVRQIEKNPLAAVAGDWFTGHGRGENLGFIGRAENRQIADKLKEVFSEWICNGHTDLKDENTIILRVELTDGILLSHGTKYEL